MCIPVAHISAANFITKDTVSKREGTLTGGSRYTEDAGGRSGQAGDSGIDFGAGGSGPIVVDDGSFLNVAAANDEMSFSFWSKKYDIAAGSAFWAISPSSNNGQRGWQAHVPWDNSNIYFDTAGCCAGNQRINASIAGFQPYIDFNAVLVDPGIAWWKEWHHFVFSKKGGSKEIWIDGVFFLGQADGATALPTDFTKLMIGSDNAGNGLFHAIIDDFAVFSTQLSPDDISKLAGGAKANSAELESASGLLAYWDFNDPPSEGQFISVTPADGTTAAVPNLIQVVHLDGGIPWDQGNVSLKVDGVSVVPTVTKDGQKATVSFVPTKPYEIKSSHSAALTYPTAGGAKVLEWSFVVAPYTLDYVSGRAGSMTGGSGFTLDAEGITRAPGDRAVDFGRNGTGPVVVGDVSFLNAAAVNDEVSFVFWSKKYDIAASSAFWAVSPSSNNGQRGYQAHVPWSDNTIYFDSVGCCAGNQRLNGGIGGFPPYVEANLGQAWWQDWHMFVFSKKQGNKQVWIDGTLFLEQPSGASPLPQDFIRLMIGSDGGNGLLTHGLVDDFAVFSTQLVEGDVQALAAGAKPFQLASDRGLLAYWDFNDFPANGIFASIIPTPDSIDALPNLIQVVNQQGSSAWDLSKVSLKLDGKEVPAEVTLDGDKLTVKHVPAVLLPPKSAHTVVLTYLAGADLLTKTWQFTVCDYTFDTVQKYLGALRGAAKFSNDGGGRSGSPGDFAIDLGQNQTGQAVEIPDAGFLNEAAANDEIAVGGWQKLYGIHNSAFFWGVSPTSNGGQRGFGTHAPWGDNNLYFDTAGCCGGDQRTSAAITSFAPYQEANAGEAWWQDWHYVLFQKKGSTKEIWIDGQLFKSGDNTKILPVDFTRAYIGLDPVDANSGMQGLVDDVAIFKTALTEPDIILLASGALPTELSSDLGLIAYWNFNDGGTPGVRLSVSRSGAQINLSWTGGVAPFVVQHKASLTDAVWETVTTTQTSSATVNIQGAAGFFRISAQ